MPRPVPSARSKITVAQDGPGQRAKHLFAPCLHCHANGQLLIVCRWDTHGADEGDATNEQALFFSRDRGATWTLSGDGPILTCALGTSFDRPSSITHAWVFEDRAGSTWLYYTINQPFTWGQNRPDRSTGGGEIRRQEIRWDGSAWRHMGASQVVWAFQQALPDGNGGVCRDIRTVAWNGLARLADGTLVMPVGGRSAVTHPEGAFAKLNRVWVLLSRDDGATWPEAHFVGGGDHLCLAEPTLAATTTPGELVCLLRVQYQTGNQLHRTISRDGGRTWSPPRPTGLPQADTQGAKPFLLRRQDNTYALIQTNEHETIERTNIAVFFTNEAGLKNHRWPRLRTLHVGNRRGWWPGACYGWLAEDNNGDLLAAWPSHDATGGRLFFARLRASELAAPVMLEANGVHDELGDHMPRSTDTNEFSLCDARSRLIAPDFGLLPPDAPRLISLRLRAESLPVAQPFRVLHFTARNGRDKAGTLLLDHAGWHWQAGDGKLRLDLGPPAFAWMDIRCRLDGLKVELCTGHEIATVTACIAPTGLQVGGSPLPAACRISVCNLVYHAVTQPCTAHDNRKE